MQQELNIMILEDDNTACSSFKKVIDKYENLNLVYSTNDSETALTKTGILMPNVVILDLELHMGRGSGIDYLSKLPQNNKPFIIVTICQQSRMLMKIKSHILNRYLTN